MKERQKQDKSSPFNSLFEIHAGADYVISLEDNVVTFNSLFEIPTISTPSSDCSWFLSILFLRFWIKWWESEKPCWSFNSLFEIRACLRPNLSLQYKCFQFSFWDSQQWELYVSPRDAKTFNSLFEILRPSFLNDQPQRSFNSLFEIHKLMCLGLQL